MPATIRSVNLDRSPVVSLLHGRSKITLTFVRMTGNQFWEPCIVAEQADLLVSQTLGVLLQEFLNPQPTDPDQSQVGGCYGPAKRNARHPIMMFAQEHRHDRFSSYSQFVAINQTCRATRKWSWFPSSACDKRAPALPTVFFLLLLHVN